MSRASILKIAAASLMCSILSASPARAQSACLVVRGIGNVESSADCGTAPGGGSTVMITLTGSFDLLTRDLSNTAIVSCWVCETGNCTTSGLYGPSKVEYILSPSGNNRSVGNWSVPFRFLDEALTSGTTTFPTFNSYRCRLQLEYRPRGADSGAALPPTVPDYFANAAHARAEQGSNLVVELSGSFTQPVSNRR